MALRTLKIALGIIAVLLGIPILISPIGIIGHFSYVISRVGTGLTLILGGTWVVWMNW